jgi:hypothetical protein
LLRVVHDFLEGDVIDVVPRRFNGHMEGAALDGRDVETVQCGAGSTLTFGENPRATSTIIARSSEPE